MTEMVCLVPQAWPSVAVMRPLNSTTIGALHSCYRATNTAIEAEMNRNLIETSDFFVTLATYIHTGTYAHS